MNTCLLPPDKVSDFIAKTTARRLKRHLETQTPKA